MAKPTLASLQAEIASLQAEIAALRAEVEALKTKPTRRGPWQPSQKSQDARAEYLRRKAAGENVVVRGGVCVLV